MKELSDQQIADLLADDTLDREQGDADHEVPADLIELYEVLEWQGVIVAPRLRSSRALAAGEPGSFVSRAGWGARTPRGRTSLNNPQGVTFHYEGPKMGTFPHSSCATKVRAIQNFHMDGRGWTDIAYNELVCPHGVIFEGRGIDVRSAANGTNAGNGSSHAVCAITGVGDAHPSELFIGLLAARQVLMSGGTGSRTWCHRDWKSTSCPGDPIFNWQRAGMPTVSTNPTIPTKPPEVHPVTGVPRTDIKWTSPQGYLVLFEDGGFANYGDAPSANDISCAGAQPYPEVKAIAFDLYRQTPTSPATGVAVLWDNGNIDTRFAPHLGEPLLK